MRPDAIVCCAAMQAVTGQTDVTRETFGALLAREVSRIVGDGILGTVILMAPLA